MIKTADFKRSVDGLLKPANSKAGKVDARIKVLLPSVDDEIVPYKDFQRLGKGLLREQLLDGVDNQYYIDIMEVTHSYLGWNQNAIRGSSAPCWQGVIAACSEEMLLPQTDWLREHDKEYKLATATKWLRESGPQIKIEGCSCAIENDDIIFDILIRRICEADGRRLLKMLLGQMEYLGPEGRFLTDMNDNTPNPKDVIIIKPYSYLVSLALTNINADGGSSSEAVKASKEAISLAIDYCLLEYPVQNFGDVWEDLFHKDRDAVEFFRNLVYKKNTFGLTQHSVWFSKMFCERVLMYMRSTGKVLENGCTFDEYERLMNHVLSTVDTLKCVELRKDRLNKLGINAIEQLVNDVATGDDILNKGFRTPLDNENENAFNEPLIKVNGKIYALPVAIGSWEWFETLMTVVRNQGKEDSKKGIGKEVGELIEVYIKEKLDEKSITHCCGHYLHPVDGEADLVVKATEGIMLFEIKKKSLTRMAKSGDGFRIVSDLLESLVGSQAQCFRTSHLMIKDGYVDLDDGNGNVARVEKQDRTAEYILVCLGVLGSLQDRILIKNIMDEICNKSSIAEYNGDDEQTTKDVKKFNKDMQKWMPFLNEERTNGDPETNPFFSSWFLDLEQLMLIVKESNPNDELLDRLRETKHVAMGSYDFYREYKMVRMMNGNKK